MSELIQTPVQCRHVDWTDETADIGVECRMHTRRGWLCRDHARSELGLLVKESDIPNSGLGLFATRDFAKHQIIDTYLGTIVDAAEWQRHPNHYGVGLWDGSVLAPTRSTESFALWANDRRNIRNNSVLLSERQYWLNWAPKRLRHSRGSGKVVLLVSLRKIVAGTEILAWYNPNGNGDYWQD